VDQSGFLFGSTHNAARALVERRKRRMRMKMKMST
jgi:hypothetical protein